MNADEAQRLTNMSKTKQINLNKIEFEKVKCFFDLKIRQAADDGLSEVKLYNSDFQFDFKFGGFMRDHTLNHYREKGFTVFTIDGVIYISWGW